MRRSRCSSYSPERTGGLGTRRRTEPSATKTQTRWPRSSALRTCCWTWLTSAYDGFVQLTQTHPPKRPRHIYSPRRPKIHHVLLNTASAPEGRRRMTVARLHRLKDRDHH